MAIAQLKGTVKHYDWGGKNYIPSLLNVVNEAGQPFAEYWMGVHAQADAQLIFPDHKTSSLSEFIESDPAATLGTSTWEHFHGLPYLLKVLDVNDMLSIQVHPSKEAARAAFDEENARGIALSDPKRNYKDDNHKPELMVAIGEFWLLHGFRPPESMKEIFSNVPELQPLLPIFGAGDYSTLYRHLMELPQEQVNAWLGPLLDRIIPLYQKAQLSMEHPDYWAAKAHLHFSRPGITDRGIFSIYMFNLVHLQNGEAVFQDAGVPHAYLQGVNVEIMSSSDNVLRGGLTSKHIDVPELLKHVKCEPTHPDILKGTLMGDQRVYQTKAPDFELSSYSIEPGQPILLHPHTAEILLLMEGSAIVRKGGEEIVLGKGNPSAVIFPGDGVELTSTQNSLVFKAGVPNIPGIN